MLIFRRIFFSNYWWQKSDIWSQALYWYPISWEAFLNPSDSYFLFADFVDFYTHWTYSPMCSKTLPTIWGIYMKLVTKYQISAINSGWEKCDEKWAYMFNVYKNQQSRETGSRNLMFIFFILIKTKVKCQIKTLLLYHLSFLHALMKFKDIDKIKIAISETL
jgi:hypothetical protein